MRRSALVLVSVLVPASLAGQGQSPFDAIPWRTGPTKGDLGSEAQVAVPGGCMFTGRDGVKQFMDLTQNTSSDAERGVLFCQPAAGDDAPWFVVPADNKWFTRVVVGAAIIDALASLDLHYPKVGKEKLKELAEAKKGLLAE